MINRDDCCYDRFEHYSISVGLNPDVWQNTACIISGTMKDGGWFFCGDAGNWLGVFSKDGTFVNFVEIMAYTQYAVQITGLYFGDSNYPFPGYNPIWMKNNLVQMKML